MTSLAELLEDELEEAVEVKNRKSLHRLVALLLGTVVDRSELANATESLKSDIRVIAETVKEGFRRMDERFAAVDRRFAAADRRFEDMQTLMNARFDATDRRFEDMNKRFETVDKRFADAQTQMNLRFATVDKRFEDMNKRFTMMFSFMTVGFTLLATIMSVYRFLLP